VAVEKVRGGSLQAYRLACHSPRRDSLLDYAAMKIFSIRSLCVVAFLATLGTAQDVIPLNPATGPDSTQENYPEKEYIYRKNKNQFHNRIVPSITLPLL
jgi:hypothetical protein